MDTTEIIAERSLLFISPDGTEISSSIQIGRPRSDAKHDFRCDFEIPNVEKRRFAAGVDTLQALLLTISLAESILESKRARGWRMLWPDTRDEILPKSLFEAEHFKKTRDPT
jgi:hypothetical protein